MPAPGSLHLLFSLSGRLYSKIFTLAGSLSPFRNLLKYHLFKRRESQRTGQQTCKPPCLCTWDQSPHIRSYHRAFPPSLPYRVPCFYELIATGCPPVSLPVVHNHPEMAVNMPRIIRLSTYQAIRGHLWGMTLLTRDVSWHTDPYNHPLVTFPKKILMENPVQFRKLLFQRCSWLGCKALRSRMSFNLDAQAQFGYKGISL